MNTISKIIATNLRNLRTQAGWTQSTAAERADIPLRTYQRAEDGRHTVDMSTLEGIGRAFEVPVFTLFQPPEAFEAPITPRRALGVIEQAIAELERRAPVPVSESDLSPVKRELITLISSAEMDEAQAVGMLSALRALLGKR